MKNNNKYREKILNSPAYWVEGINGLLYDAILTYMEKHDMKRKDLAKHLDVSKGRISQILNSGEINFSLEKIIEIALKVDKYPNFLFEDKSLFLEKERQLNTMNKLFFIYNINEVSNQLPISSGLDSIEPGTIRVGQTKVISGSFCVTDEYDFSI